MDSIKYISTSVKIDTNTAKEIYDNGETGNTRVTLCKACMVGRDGAVWYLETNGDPVLIDETNEHECAIDLGLSSAAELQAKYD